MKRPSKKIWFSGLLLLPLILAALSTLNLGSSLRNRYHSSMAIYSSDGRLLRLTLSNDQKYRLWVSLKNISSKLKQAVIESEDRYFYSHMGFNPWSLIRASWLTYVAGGRRSGASTITMQLARKIYSIDSRHVGGKIQQIAAALILEFLYSKDDLLEAYLNLMPMGGNIEGVGAASLIFYSKRAKDLNWSDAITFAVIPQNPTKRTLLEGYPKELADARYRLFQKLFSQIPADNHAVIQESVQAKHIRDLPFWAPHYVNAALDRASGKNEIQGTLDLNLQNLLEKRVRQYLETQKSKGVRNAAAVLIDWRSSKVLAYLGSANFFDGQIYGQVDGVQALRSPGSALKPFIYSLAIEEGMIHPRTMLKDSPKSFASYDPENFDGEFKGPLSAEEALNQSRNLPAVDLVSRLKKRDFYQFLLDSGVGVPRNRDYYGFSIALGGFEVTLLDLVRLYSALPNKGWMSPIALMKSEMKPARAVQPKSALSEEAAFLVLDMLSRSEIQSQRFRRLERQNSIPVSWKTGTSSGFRDAWTLGIFGQYALGVWLGNFDGQGNRYFIGRETAAPLFFEIVDSIKATAAIDETALMAWYPPPSVKPIHVCAVSGKIPGPHCHHQTKVSFIPGVSPIDRCDIHREVWISKLDGKISCSPDPRRDRSVVLEFWPSDLLQIFAKAGLPRKELPAASSDCRDTLRAQFGKGGNPPEIISPRESTIYSLRSGHRSENIIPFQANIDAAAKELFWFVDKEFVGTSKPEQPFFWPARSGTFELRAVDSVGRASVRKLEVRYAD